MAADCHAYSFVGFRVSKSDLYEDVPVGVYTCRQEHTFTPSKSSLNKKPKFCSYCGGELIQKTQREFTEMFLGYCRLTVEMDPYHVLDLWNKEYENKGPRFCNATEASINDSGDVLILGIEVLATRSHRNYRVRDSDEEQSVDLDSLMEHFNTMRVLANELHSENRVLLYTSLHVC